MVKDFY